MTRLVDRGLRDASGYIFLVSSKDPGWLLGRLTGGKLSVISYGKLNAIDLLTPRPRLRLATDGDAARAFIDTYPVASGKFASLRFRQPSLLRLDAEIIAAHWCIEDGQGKIRTHHLKVSL
jgi:hypothetical protein